MENNVTDKGWSAMREILDREMPVKRNRAGGWLLLLLLLPVVGAAAWLWQQRDNGPVSQPKAVAAKSQVPKADSGAAPTSNLGQPMPAERLRDVEISQTVQVKTAQSKGEKKAAKITKEPAAAAYALLFDAKTQNAQATENQMAASVAALPTNLIPVPYPIPVETPQNDKQADNLSAKPTFFNAQTRPLKEMGWRFGATNILSSEKLNTVNGFAAGAVADWHASPKWGLRMGLQYGIYSPQAERRPVATVQSSSYIKSIPNGLFVFDGSTGKELIAASNSELSDSLGNMVLIPVRRLQRLEMPLLAFWKPRPYLKILGGVQMARTLSTRADAENYSGEYVLRLSDKEAESNASQLSVTGMNKWSVEASAGTSVRLNSLFEVGMMARLPLIKTEVVTGYDPSNSAGFDADKIRQKRNVPTFTLYGTMFF
jgi:hypothetical protein